MKKSPLKLLVIASKERGSEIIGFLKPQTPYQTASNTKKASKLLRSGQFPVFIISLLSPEERRSFESFLPFSGAIPFQAIILTDQSPPPLFQNCDSLFYPEELFRLRSSLDRAWHIVTLEHQCHQLTGQLKRRQSQKLLALGHLSAGLAHELRNPLAVISSCAQFSIEKLKLERPLAENLQMIYRNSQKASRLIEELLSFAKPSPLDQKDVEIKALLKHVLEMTRLEARKSGVTSHLEIDSRTPSICGDESKLEQAFLNITLNAFQAVSHHGEVILRTNYVPRKNNVEIEVVDNGHGIPLEYRHQVFDPFFTTKDNGTGLGLSITHAIIKQHGGDIRVSSPPEGGATLCITLPVENKPYGRTW